MVKLSEKVVLARSRANDLNGVKTLNCWGGSLSDVSLLTDLPNVEVINFSANAIEDLEPFTCCTNLKELYLRRNKLKDIDQVEHLKQLNNLRLLWLSGNPFCEKISSENYRLAILKVLPNLLKLDDKTVSKEELLKARQFEAEEKGQGDASSTKDSTPAEKEDAQTTNEMGDSSELSSVKGDCVKEVQTTSSNLSTADETNSPNDGEGSESNSNIAEEKDNISPEQVTVNTAKENSDTVPAAGQTNCSELASTEQSQSLIDNSKCSPVTEDSAQDVDKVVGTDISPSSEKQDADYQESIPSCSTSPAKSEGEVTQQPSDTVKSTDSAMQMSLDEANQLRVQLGLKPLTAAKFGSSVSPPKKLVKRTRPKKVMSSLQSNLLTATMALIAELDDSSLEIVQDAISERLQEGSDKWDRVEEVYDSTIIASTKSTDYSQPTKETLKDKISGMLEPA